MATPFLSSEEYDERAHELYNEGQYDAALDVLREGLNLYPESVELHIGAGFARLAREEYAWARRSFEVALVLDALHEEALAGLGETLLKFGLRDEAMKAFRKILDLGYDDDLDLVLQVGRALFREEMMDEAREFFDVGRITGPLDILREVGLGYVRLGQPARTLSGGERQRLVLATGLMQPGGGPTLYLFDEPTTGLHADDVAQLLRVFDRLIAAGHTLIVIEHNLDVIAASDWIVDLGPEGGDRGGRIVAEGPPETVAAHPESHTGRALERGWPRVEPSGPD